MFALENAYFIPNRVLLVKPFLLLLLRGALFITPAFFANTLFSQQLQPSSWNDPAIAWLTPAQAQLEVQSQLALIEPQLAPLTPGTGQHTDLLRRILFYKSVLLSLINGSTVQQAIESAIPEAASLGGAYEYAFTSEATLRALCDEAVDLLSD